MLSRVEGLVGRWEAGEPVLPRLQALLEREIAVCAMPVAEDMTGVRAALQTLLLDPSPRNLPDLRRAVEEALASAPTDGPTASPRANELLGMALAALQDGAVDFSGAARGFSWELTALSTQVAASATERLADEARGIGEAALRAREALYRLEAAVRERREDAVRQEGEAFIAGMRMLASAQRTLERLADQEGRTPCVRCGESNPGDRSTCQRCSAILPAAVVGHQSLLDLRVGEDRPPETRMTVNLARLLDACDRYYAGALDGDAFLAEVEWMEGLLGQARRMGFEEAAREGLQSFEEGLALLRQAGETGDAALLDAGRRLVWEGAGGMQAAS